MVSDFKKKKFLHVFAFLDVNKDGVIEKSDFVASFSKIAKARGYEPGDMAYSFMEEMIDVMWDGLEKAADSNCDGRISSDEWVKLWDRYSQNHGDGGEWNRLYAKNMFQLMDFRNDGQIDSEEFEKFFEQFKIPKEESLEAFKEVTVGKGKITWEEYEVLFKEFFLGDDVYAPGSFIFGLVK